MHWAGFERGRAPLAAAPLFAHIKQQSVVDVVDTEHGHNNDRVKNEIFIALDILEEKDQRYN
jgi:hypothetical protein